MSFASGAYGGAGGDSLPFGPCSEQEVPGVRATAKICELCGRMFFRDAKQKECRSCEAFLSRVPERVPLTNEKRDKELEAQCAAEMADRRRELLRFPAATSQPPERSRLG